MSHYLKVLMDSVFGRAQFRNEIVWKRTGSHGGAKRWGPVHDTLLFYTVSSKYTWNRTFQEYSPEYLANYYKYSGERGKYRLVSLTASGTRTGESGRPWRGVDPTIGGRHWAVPKDSLRAAFPDRTDLDDLSTQEKLDLLDRAGLVHWPQRGSKPQQKRYADETQGVHIQDIISDINVINAQALERTGYPTQKPLALLNRIILASSNRGDVVLDPFCGSGTACVAAARAGRRWIGIDANADAIRIASERLAG